MIKQKVNLVVIATSKTREILIGIFSDVMETMRWGLVELGYDVLISVNDIHPDRTNIVFAFHMLTLPQLDLLPPDTVLYNMEQLEHGNPLRPTFHAAVKRFQIWEYSAGNLSTWAGLKPALPVVHVPIGWAPVLERIPGDTPQDIDVLFFGVMTPSRVALLPALAHLRTVFATNVYGPSRDGLIARSKIILAMSSLGSPVLFPTVRISFAIANAKAVVTDRKLGTYIEEDLSDAVMFAKPMSIVRVCEELLENDAQRRALGIRGQGAMRKRDIRAILKSVLG